MRYFDKALVAANPRFHGAWHDEVVAARNWFAHKEAEMASASGAVGVTNAAAQIPLDVWREMDTVTKRVARHDEGAGYMGDLMPLAKPIHIGKVSHMTRVASDAGTVKRSISGQVGAAVGKVEYTYQESIVPLFHTSYGREWREWNAQASEGFDGLMDDEDAHNKAILKDQATYVLDGDSSLTHKGVSGDGIRSSSRSKTIDLGSGGANIDLTSCSPAEAEAFISGPFGAMLDANYIVDAPVNLYVSPEIARNFDKRTDMSWGTAGGYTQQTARELLMKHRRIKKIEVTHMLTGNEFFGFVPDSNYIRPLVGMAISTIPVVRLNMTDNYQFLKIGALGLDIRADFNGRSGVFYSVVI